MKTFLVPTDFSKAAFIALKYAIQFALQSGSRLVLFHSAEVHPMVSGKEEFRMAVKEFQTTTKLKLQTTYSTAYKELRLPEGLLNVKFEALPGIFVVENILEVSKACKANLIIMGTHGASGINRVLFGSNTAIIISRSEIPVLAIPQKYHFRFVKNIVYASDLTNLDTELKTIVPFAKALDATIEILHFNYGWHKGISPEEKVKVAMKSYRKILFVIKKVTLEESMSLHLKRYLSMRKESILAMFEDDKSFIDSIFLSSKTEELVFKLSNPLLAMKKSNMPAAENN